MKNKEDDIGEIQKCLEDAWTSIEMTTRTAPSRKVRTDHYMSTPLTKNSVSILFSEDHRDDRWKPKKQTSRDNYKKKSKESNEQTDELPPQPFLRPLAMPKRITKSGKSKRR